MVDLAKDCSAYSETITTIFETLNNRGTNEPLTGVIYKKFVLSVRFYGRTHKFVLLRCHLPDTVLATDAEDVARCGRKEYNEDILVVAPRLWYVSSPSSS